MAHSSCTKSNVSIDLFNLPPLPDARRQSTMFCEFPIDFFLHDGKNSKLSQIINTWTFCRLTPDGNEGVGVGISYLECTYWTKYYVIDQVNGQINAINDDRIELTDFSGHFSPFNLDELEIKVCRLADCQEDEDVCTQVAPAPQKPITQKAKESDANSSLQSIEDLTGMGFDSPSYSSIPPIGNTTPQWPRGSVLTSMPIPNVGLGLNISDLTHNRGKASIVNSFANPEEKHEIIKRR